MLPDTIWCKTKPPNSTGLPHSRTFTVGIPIPTHLLCILSQLVCRVIDVPGGAPGEDDDGGRRESEQPSEEMMSREEEEEE